MQTHQIRTSRRPGLHQRRPQLRTNRRIRRLVSHQAPNPVNRPGAAQSGQAAQLLKLLNAATYAIGMLRAERDQLAAELETARQPCPHCKAAADVIARQDVKISGMHATIRRQADTIDRLQGKPAPGDAAAVIQIRALLDNAGYRDHDLAGGVRALINAQSDQDGRQSGQDAAHRRKDQADGVDRRQDGAQTIQDAIQDAINVLAGQDSKPPVIA